MNPYDPRIEARLAPDARSVELVRGITFEFADGTRQACRSTGVYALD